MENYLPVLSSVIGVDLESQSTLLKWSQRPGGMTDSACQNKILHSCSVTRYLRNIIIHTQGKYLVFSPEDMIHIFFVLVPYYTKMIQVTTFLLL